jgi:FlaG/FlaF family flagellin (archaellin)
MELNMKSLSSKPVKVLAAVLAAVVTTAVFGSFETIEYTEAARIQAAQAKAARSINTVKLEPIVVTAQRIA